MRSSPKLPLRVRIMEVIPNDSQFTLADIIEWLDDDVSPATVRTTLHRLVNRGEIKLARRGNKKSPALFVVTGSSARINTLNVVSQIQAAEIVLEQIGHPVEISVLVDEMLNRGFIPHSDVATLKKSLATAMRLKSQFVSEGRLWSVAKR